MEARTDSRLSAAAQAASAEAKGQKPPPRPIHRYPSWEDRIYQVASEGMKDATGDQMGDSKNNNQDQQNGYGSDINVPVYATVKGVSHKVVHREILSKTFNMDLQFWAIQWGQLNGNFFIFAKVSYFWNYFFYIFMGKTWVEFLYILGFEKNLNFGLKPT